MRPTMRAATCLLVLFGCTACPPQPAGDAGTSITWDAAFDTSGTGWLLNAWGASPTDVYAVGGRTDAGTVMHSDGAGWQRVEVAAPLLNWAFGLSPTDVFVVGNEGTVLHFDGTRWVQQATPTRQPLWGVWGAAPDDVWAVGGDGAEQHATLLHYDGASWAMVVLPPLQKARVGQLLKVWGTGADDVYVVGQRGVVLHRTAGAWKEELVGASDDLVSVWGAGGVVVAVGGRSNALVSRWDGTKWTTKDLAPAQGLNGVWTRDGKTAHVAGVSGTLGRLDLATLTLTLDDVAVSDDLHSIFGVGQRLITVGGNLQSANPAQFKGVALERALKETE